MRPISTLTKITILNCSATQVDNLDACATLTDLKQISCYNTNVKKLDGLKNLTKLKLIECYNTRVNEKRIKKFKNVTKSKGVKVIF